MNKKKKLYFHNIDTCKCQSKPNQSKPLFLSRRNLTPSMPGLQYRLHGIGETSLRSLKNVFSWVKTQPGGLGRIREARLAGASWTFSETSLKKLDNLHN